MYTLLKRLFGRNISLLENHCFISEAFRLVQFTGAKLYVIHIVNPAGVIDEEAKNNKDLLQKV